jgi:hypothetical protein
MRLWRVQVDMSGNERQQEALNGIRGGLASGIDVGTVFVHELTG